MVRWLRALWIGENVILHHLHRIERIVTVNQDKLDALSAQLETATTGLAQDIADLKAQPGSEVLDFTALDARVEALTALDAQNPVVPPA